MQVLTPKGYKHLVSISKKTQDNEDNNMTIVAGDYVLIQSTPEGSRYPAEIIRVIDHEYEKYCRENNLWPTPYDVEGYVERLAEKIQFTEAANKPKNIKVLYHGANKTLDKILNGPCRYFHSKGKDTQQDIDAAQNAANKVSKRELLCKQKMCKSDKDCILNSPFFPDVDFPTMFDESLLRISAHCLTDVKPTLNCSTSTKIEREVETSKCCTVVKPVRSSTACCCKKSCYGASATCQPPLETKTIGSGPTYSFITVGRDQLPSLYGTCTPWQMDKKRLKKLREERDDTLFTRVNN